jgi:multidrug efflux pump subunit AcrB
MIEKMIGWFTENHVAANLLMFFLLLAGFLTVQTIKIETFPEFAPDMISISMEYPGASPEEVEEAIIRRLEERIAGLAGIKKITASAREGFASVTIEVISNWDLDLLTNEVKSEVDRIRTFPNEAEKPIVRQIVRKNQVINIALYGDAPEPTIKHLAEKIKADLVNLPGITLVEIFGVRRAEMHLDISESNLRRYGLTLDRVASIVQQSSLDLPAGSVKSKEGTVLIRTKGRRYKAKEYADIAIITNPDGSKVTLGQIATLTDGYEDNDLKVSTRGKPAAFIEVYRVADQSALKVAAAVKRYVSDIRGDLPEGMDIVFFRDSSLILKSRIHLLVTNMTYGLILVVILLSLFLNVRLAFWVTMGIPISFATGLWLLPVFGISINMISLFAFILILGIVVDDAIVIGENIYRKREKGLAPFESAVQGASQVSKPVIFAVLTTMAAFWPLLMVPGTRGNIMRNIPVVVIVVLAGSLIEALLILPAHLSRCHFKNLCVDPGEKKQKKTDKWLKDFVKGPYRRFLALCLRWRYATVAVGAAVLILTVGVIASGRIKLTIFPRLDADNLICSIVMPPSTPVSRTEEVLDHIEKAALETMAEADAKRPAGAPSVMEDYFTLVGVHMGGGGPFATSEIGGHLAQVHIQLLDGEKRNMKSTDLVSEWRRKVGVIPEAESISFRGQIGSSDAPIEVHLSSDDTKKLFEAVESLKSELREYPGLTEVADNYMPGKEEMQLKLRPEARSLGMTLRDLASQVRGAFYGAEALRLQIGEDEVKVLVRYPDGERRSIGNVSGMRIRMPDGTEVPFRQVAEVTMVQGYATIQRAYRKRVIAVSADIEEGQANTTEVNRALEATILPAMRERHPEVRFGIEGQSREDSEFMGSVLKSFALALFLIYALLAIPFRSFTQPLIVMAAIPFGIVGAVLGHKLMGYDLSMMSLFGIVGLSGVVVNDSLVLIEATNRIREGGRTAAESITAAGELRFRAIILTSITTFGGLTPMLLERSLQAKFLIPMAAGLGWGVLFATGITLLIIPCLYLILEDLKIFGGKVFPGSPD